MFFNKFSEFKKWNCQGFLLKGNDVIDGGNGDIFCRISPRIFQDRFPSKIQCPDNFIGLYTGEIQLREEETLERNIDIRSYEKDIVHDYTLTTNDFTLILDIRGSIKDYPNIAQEVTEINYMNLNVVIKNKWTSTIPLVLNQKQKQKLIKAYLEQRIEQFHFKGINLHRKKTQDLVNECAQNLNIKLTFEADI